MYEARIKKKLKNLLTITKKIKFAPIKLAIAIYNKQKCPNEDQMRTATKRSLSLFLFWIHFCLFAL
jgi:hypothetical protein